MRNDYAFLVEKASVDGSKRKPAQFLFCRCGYKQKSKMTLRRSLMRNLDKIYEDSYQIDAIECANCGESYSVLNNLIGLKPSKNVLVEIRFVRENAISGILLKKKRKYYSYNEDSDELVNFEVSDSIAYFPMKKIFTIEYDTAPDSSKNNTYQMLETEFKTSPEFDLNNTKKLENFFSFNSVINYVGLEVAFDFFDEILKDCYDYKAICDQKFLSDFKVSKKVYSEEVDGRVKNFILKRSIFGNQDLIRKKLDVGDYLNKLLKFSELCMIFTHFNPISTLFKLKGLDFIHKSFKNGLLAPKKEYEKFQATSPSKILEVCCRYHWETNLKYLSTDFKLFDNLKFSPVILRSIQEPDDLVYLYKFFQKNIISKIELELILQKYDNKNVFRLMSKLVSSSNFRNVQLDIRHINHILKYNILREDSNDMLNLYYDTINSLNLIVGIIEEKKKEGKNNSQIRRISKISQDKLFEIKSFEKLKNLHDEMSAVYRALEDEGKDLRYRSIVKKYTGLNVKRNMFEFKVIPNLNELSKEGLVMHHCIYTYLNDIASGNYLAIRVKDLISKERATMGIKISDGKLFLQQLKGYYNSRPTKLLIQESIEYCDEMQVDRNSNILHVNDLEPNPSLEKRMRDYLDPKEANALRLKTLKKNKKNLDKL